MLLDICVILVIVFAVYKGLRKGLVVAVFSFVAFLIGLAAALKLSAMVATWLDSAARISQRWLPVVAFLLVFFIVILLVRLGAKLIEKLLSIAMMGWINKSGGIIFYLLIYFYILSTILFYAVQLNIVDPQASASYPYIEPIAPKVMQVMGNILPALKNLFAELLAFFQQVSDNHSSS